MARHLRRALNFESEFSTAAKRRSFKIRSAAIEFKFLLRLRNVNLRRQPPWQMWALKLRRWRRLKRTALKFTPKLQDLRAGFKIYPEISAAMHIAMHATACRFFVGRA